VRRISAPHPNVRVDGTARPGYNLLLEGQPFDSVGGSEGDDDVNRAPPAAVALPVHDREKGPVSRPPFGLSWRASATEASQKDRVVSPSLEVLEDVGHSGPDDLAAVGRYPVLGTELQSSALQAHEVLTGAVEGDLLLVTRALLGRLDRSFSDL
jgi:hypothetical protein